ncbi:MAG: beta-lactamase family protein [Anaerolineae bacterium]|nr:beta-lactamase family protein [Anaerolineae bacterium]
MKTKILSVGITLLTLCSILLAPATFAAGSDDFSQEIEGTLDERMAHFNVPGVSIALIEGGEIAYAKSFGYSDKATQTPMTPDTLYQVASVSKGLTAWGIMRLVDEGKIGLDDPVEKYLTRWHIPPSPYDANGVTVRRLLNHTAGIALEGYGAGVPVGEPLPSLEASLLGDNRGCGAVRLVREPGKAMMYSGGGYTILQLLVEEVTGQVFADYMKKNILNPLGMTDSTFVWDEQVQSRLSRAYGTYYNTIPNQTYIEDAAGGLYSSLNDMARYAQVILDGSAVLSQESFDLLFQGDSYGLGYGLIDFPGSERFIFGGGTRMGWQSDFVVFPEDGSGIVILSNANGGSILNLEIIDHWVEWKTGSSWPGAELFFYQYPILLGIAIALGIACTIYAITLSLQFRRKRRVFLLQSRRNKILRIFWIVLVLAVTIVWWLYCFTPTFDPQIRMLWAPEPFLYVSILGTVLASAMITGSLFPTQKSCAGISA